MKSCRTASKTPFESAALQRDSFWVRERREEWMETPFCASFFSETLLSLILADSFSQPYSTLEWAKQTQTFARMEWVSQTFARNEEFFHKHSQTAHSFTNTHKQASGRSVPRAGTRACRLMFGPFLAHLLSDAHLSSSSPTRSSKLTANGNCP